MNSWASAGLSIDGGAEVDIDAVEYYQARSAVVHVDPGGQRAVSFRLGAGRMRGRVVGSDRRAIGGAALAGIRLKAPQYGKVALIASADYLLSSMQLRSSNERVRVYLISLGMRIGDGTAGSASGRPNH